MVARPPVAVGVALGVLLASSFCFAAPVRIRLSRSANGSALVRELTARAAGEAVAAGFSVELQEQSTANRPRGDAEVMLPGTSFFASIFIGATGDGFQDGLIEVTVDRQVIYRATVGGDQVTPTDGGRILSAAAVRAVAALQTALLGRGPSFPAPSVLPAAASPADIGVFSPALVRRPSVGRPWIAVAAALLQSLQGIPPAFAPMARFGYQATDRVSAGFRLMGLGTSSQTAAPAGSARVRQDLAMADLTFRFRPDKRIHPLLMAGAGVYHMSLEGTGTSPYVGRNDRFWSAATAAGVGVVIDITPRLSMALESHTLWVWPQPTVQIESVETGRTGRPSLTHSLGLLVWL